MQHTMPVEGRDLLVHELLNRLNPGDEVIFTRNQLPIAKLISEPTTVQQRRVPGLGKGFIKVLQDDDEHLEHFAEFMP